MQINYSLKGNARKELVKAISEITGTQSKYKGAPTFAYKIGGVTVDKNGIMEYEDESLKNSLAERGFAAEPTAKIGVSIDVPKADFTDTAIDNLQKLISSKATLIKKVLDTDNLDIEISKERICFPWFSPHGNEALIHAYTHFVTALCDMAKSQSRINANEKEVANEKYAFRCFLLRLGFIGAKYKEIRKVLLKNLVGSSAFKEGVNNEISK